MKEELRANFTRALAARNELLSGVVGYDCTVIPEIANAMDLTPPLTPQLTQ